jgi:hypothetical protein
MKCILEHPFNNSRKLKASYILSTAINTHHKTLHVVFTGSSEWINYMYTLWLGSTNFPKKFQAISKS